MKESKVDIGKKKAGPIKKMVARPLSKRKVKPVRKVEQSESLLGH